MTHKRELQFDESACLEKEIQKNLKRLGYGG